MVLTQVAEKTHLENCIMVWNACFCLAESPVSHFIDMPQHPFTPPPSQSEKLRKKNICLKLHGVFFSFVFFFTLRRNWDSEEHTTLAHSHESLS